jgi:digeranylgeranylglycerophospholipid reductase
MRDVIIVGGGPGGLHAAARLARNGHDVVVLEEHRDFGEPVHCTGVLAVSAIDEVGLSREVALNPLSTATFYSPSGQHISYRPPSTEALVIDRVAFDRELSMAAKAAGAVLERGTRVTAISVDRSHARLQTDQGRVLTARAVVLACGASYAFQRRLGLGMPAVHLNSAQLELAADRDGDVELFFGSALAPRGFAWAVPVTRPSGRRVRIGLMCEGDPAPHFHRVLAKVGPSWGIHAKMAVEPRRRLLPLGPIRKTYGNRVLAIGDAAGLVKPTTGGGIYYSVISAGIASDVLTDALRRDQLGEESLGDYQSCWRRRLAPELRAQLALRMVAQRLTDAEIDHLFDLARTDGIMPIVHRTARFNNHRDLIVALFRHPPARRLLFRRVIG